MIRTEKDVEQEIRDALHWEPSLHDDDITVHVDDNVITIEGQVNSEEKKKLAEDLAKRKAGVSSIINAITVAGSDDTEQFHSNDSRLRHEVKLAIRELHEVSPKWIKVTVQDGWVTLEGTVQHAEQSDHIRHAAADVRGVKGVANLIRVAHHEETQNSKKMDNRFSDTDSTVAEKTDARTQVEKRQGGKVHGDFRSKNKEGGKRDRKQKLARVLTTIRLVGKLFRAARRFMKKIRS